MKCKTLIIVSDLNNPGLHKLEASLKLFNYDYLIIHDPGINWNWGGWFHIRDWCKKQLNVETSEGYTHFIYTDGFDTLALGQQSEAEEGFKAICKENLDRFVYSCEKQLYPEDISLPYNRANYPTANLPDKYRWRYANGGQFMSSITKFLSMIDNRPLDSESRWDFDSQRWAHKKICLDNSDNGVLLDTGCQIFQSVAFTTTQYENGRIEGGIHNSLDEFSVVGEGEIYDDSSQSQTFKSKRILNNYTKTKAPLMHGNGRADFEFVYKCLNL